MATINSLNNASAPFECTGDLTITTGNLKLPTTSATVGQIMLNAVPWFHGYGTANIFVGQNAGNLTFTTSSAINNTAVGYYALNAITGAQTTSDRRNVAVGFQAMKYSVSGSTSNNISNVVIGADAAGSSSVSGMVGNVIIGDTAGYYVNSSNVYIGFEAGKGGGNGNISNNVSVGYQAFKFPTTNSGGNVCLGYKAGYGGNVYQTNYNVCIGHEAGYQMSNGGSTANLTLIGYRSGYNYTGATPENSNICIGYGVNGTAGESNKLRIGASTGTGTSGELGAAYICGVYTTTATPSGTAKVQLVDSNNLHYGLTNTASALLCVAAAGTAPTWSTGPTVTGTMSAASFATTTAATIMTLNGKTITLSGSDTDVGLVVTPKGAGGLTLSTGTLAATTFDTNVAAAGVTLTGTTLAADGTDADISITLTPKGTGTVVSTAVYAKAVGATNRAMLVDDSGLIGNATSSRKFKDNIKDMGSDSSPIMKLRPVSFTYKSDPDGHIKQGLIAEEVAEIMPSLVSYDEHHHPYTVSYHELPAMLLNEIQKLERRVRELEARLDSKEIQ